MLQGKEGAEKNILAAAIEVFEVNGFKGARMQEIAERANVNKALVHYYFRSKEKLYIKTLDYTVSLYWELLDSVFSEDLKDGNDFVEKIVRGLFSMLIENASCRNFIIKEFASGGVFLSKRDREKIEECDQHYLQILNKVQELMDKGWLKKEPPVMFLLNIESLVMGTFLMIPPIENSLSFCVEINDDFYNSRCESVIELLKSGVVLV